MKLLLAPAAICFALSLGMAQPPETPKPVEKPAPTAQPERPAAPKATEPAKAADEAAAEGDDQPGPAHARLMKLAGNWKVTVKLEMDGIPPMESTGSMKVSAELGGRFLHERGGSEAAGQQTEEFKMWGYNNASKKYEGVWTWTLATGLLHLTGESKDDGKTIDWEAWYYNRSGNKEEFKVQHAFTDDDHFSVKLFGGKLQDGTPGPTMNISYARNKEPVSK